MTTIRNVTHAANIRLSDDGKKVIIIDQTALPNRVVHLSDRAPNRGSINTARILSSAMITPDQV